MTNLPVYIGAANGTSVTESGNYILANGVTVDYPTQIQGKRLLGQAINQNDQFVFGGPSEVGISLDFILINGYSFLSNSNSGNYFPIKIGDNIFQKCFLEGFDVSIRPFEPVTIKANFKSHQPPISEGISGDATIPNLDSYLDSNKIIYGHKCSVSNAGQAVAPNILSAINYSKKYSRSPIYTLGNIYPSYFIVDQIETQMSIDSTGLNSLINFSGSKLLSDIKVTLKDVANTETTSFEVAMHSGARIDSQNYSIQGGDTLATKVQIREVIV